MILRASSIDSFFTCAWQWYQVFIEGKTSIPSARAQLGTTIHKVAENLWTEAINTGMKDTNVSKYTDMANELWKEAQQKDLVYDEKDSPEALGSLAISGTQAYVEDIVPFADIPQHVELTVRKKIKNPVVTMISGTIDYVDKETIADIKTTGRKATPSNYQVQQSIYKYLAEETGLNIKYTYIQNVVLKKQSAGQIMDIVTDVPKAKYLVNTILRTCKELHKGQIDPILLFRGNPRHYLCSPKYCAFYNECKFVKGEV